MDEQTAEMTNWQSPSSGTWGFDRELLSVTCYSKSRNICLDGVKGKHVTERIHSVLGKQDKRLEAAESRQSDQQKRTETLLTDNNNKFQPAKFK